LLYYSSETKYIKAGEKVKKDKALAYLKKRLANFLDNTKNIIASIKVKNLGFASNIAGSKI
jgi:hypothetical protein